MNNKPYKGRPEIINISSNNPVSYPFSIKTNKCSVIVIILIILPKKFVFLIM